MPRRLRSGAFQDHLQQLAALAIIFDDQYAAVQTHATGIRSFRLVFHLCRFTCCGKQPNDEGRARPRPRLSRERFRMEVHEVADDGVRAESGVSAVVRRWPGGMAHHVGRNPGRCPGQCR
jgi:hypothetical protein